MMRLLRALAVVPSGVLVFALCTLLAQYLSTVGADARFVRTEFVAGAWWQLASAQWVHWGWGHALSNTLGMALILMVLQHRLPVRVQALALLGGYGGVAVVLALDASCTLYAGASGALHGLLAGGLLALWWHGSTGELHGALGTNRTTVLWIVFGLAVKLAAQRFLGEPGVPGWQGFVSYYPAHEAGSAGGLALVGLVRVLMPHWFMHRQGQHQ